MKTYILTTLLFLSSLIFSQEDTSDSLIESKIDYTVFGIAQKDSSMLVQIVGVGDYSENVLDSVSSKIKSYFGFQTLISSKNVNIQKYFTKTDSLIDTRFFLSNFINDTITIYVTNHILYGDNFYVDGATNSNNLSIILDGRSYDIQQTVIHELGHMFGLSHCETHLCIMSKNGGLDLFCNKCLEKIYR